MNTELEIKSPEYLADNWENPENGVGEEILHPNALTEDSLLIGNQVEGEEYVEEEEVDTTESTKGDNNSFYGNLYDWFYETGFLPYNVENIREQFKDVNIDSDEGFKQVMASNIEYLAEKKLREEFSFLDDEQVSDFINVMANGGSIQDFATLYEDTDWENINIKNNIANQKKVIREDYVRQGRDEEYIDDMLEMLENSNKLEKAASSAKISLTNTIRLNREYQRDLLNQQIKEEEAMMQKEANDFLNTIKNRDTIANIVVNNEIKQQIIDFKYQDFPLYEDANKTIPYLDEYGNHVHMTPLDYALAIETPEQKATREMFSIYLILNGYNLEGVNKQIRTQEINSLEKKLKNVPKGTKTKVANPNELDRMWNNPG